MKKFLIFRTDRIGDFRVTGILIKSIKRNYPNSKIIVICSEKNIEYVKGFSLVDEAIIYPAAFFKKSFSIELVLFFSEYESFNSLLIQKAFIEAKINPIRNRKIIKITTFVTSPLMALLR